ncbi:MAG TPA: thiamine pyrophosphate-dependent enzyme [Steroidobacteraceae bacterium]|nr:thiamine pyrophosphate-dependent enzyme [Steroidobacteraceae bacterium]
MLSQQHSLVRRLATRIRLNATRMVAIQGFGYLGQALSSAEVFATLFGGAVLRPGRDRFVLSAGHYVIALYAAAAEVGLLDRAELAGYGRDGALLEAIGSERTPLVDMVCGSLGQGLSAAVGFALAAHLAGEQRATFAFLSDGELEEGQVWEAAMFASHQRQRMGRLVAIIDANNSQVDGPVSAVTTLEPMADKWRAFGWQALEVDGHDIAALTQALTCDFAGAPLALIARTSCVGRLRCLPATLDAHFLKLDEPLRAALEQELTRELQSADA